MVGKDNRIVRNAVSAAALRMGASALRPGGIVANESIRTRVYDNDVDTVGGGEGARVTAGIASLAGTHDRIEGNTVADVLGGKGDGIFVGGTGELVTTASGARVERNDVRRVGGSGIRFDASGDKAGCRMCDNDVASTAGPGISLARVRRSRVARNAVTDWGAGQPGIVLFGTAPGSPGNEIADNDATAAGAGGAGPAFSLRSAGNRVRGNRVIGAKVGVGFHDGSGGNVYEGNTFVGAVDAPFSVAGPPSSFLGGNYGTGAGAPATTPKVVGEEYLDAARGRWYRAEGTASPADRVPLN